MSKHYPTTPDGRYFVVNQRLWRCSNPNLDPEEHQRLVNELMAARRAIGQAKRQQNQTAERTARAEVQRCKVALGERGPVWWDDHAPDYNRHLIKNTPYWQWFQAYESNRTSI